MPRQCSPPSTEATTSLDVVEFHMAHSATLDTYKGTTTQTILPDDTTTNTMKLWYHFLIRHPL